MIRLSTSLLGNYLPVSMLANAFIQHICKDASMSYLSHTIALQFLVLVDHAIGDHFILED